MPINLLNDEDRETLHQSVAGRYLHGDCYSFAIAMHRRTGWPLVGAATLNGDFVHAGVRKDDGVYVDVRGESNEDDFLGYFSSAVDVVDTTEAELIAADSHLMDGRIAFAERIIETLFPHYPGGTISSKLEAFLRELEDLSRKHGFFIRARVPGCKPVIYESDGEEAGYEADQMQVGGWTFDRKF